MSSAISLSERKATSKVMAISPSEAALVAIVAGLVVIIGLCRWGYRDAIAHDAGLAWRLIAAVPIVGVIVWMRFGRARFHQHPV